MQGGGEVAPRRSGGDHDTVNDLADGFGSFRCIVGIIERCGQAFDPAPVGFGYARMNVGNGLRCVGETRGEAVLFGF